VVGEIGPVLEYDAAHATELLRTLDVYLTSGLSKSHAATALGVQRQTLYRRLALISSVLGGADLNRYERRAALEIAVTAWKLRHSAHTVSVVRRGRR
jgi:PucR family transcriptional regulator, purine catabolism regulatory protein